jgi:hypothetical protein
LGLRLDCDGGHGGETERSGCERGAMQELTTGDWHEGPRESLSNRNRIRI